MWKIGMVASFLVPQDGVVWADFRGEAPAVCLAQPNGLGEWYKDLKRGNAPAFIGADDRGVAPKPETPARWAGLGKRPGALPLIAFVSAYCPV